MAKKFLDGMRIGWPYNTNGRNIAGPDSGSTLCVTKNLKR